MIYLKYYQKELKQKEALYKILPKQYLLKKISLKKEIKRINKVVI